MTGPAGGPMERAAEVRWLADRKIDPSRRELASHGNDPTIAIHGPVPRSKASSTADRSIMHNRPPAGSSPATRPLLRRRLLGAGVARGAVLLPMSQLAARLGEIPTDPSQPVLLICHTQNRSRAALKMLRQRGMNHVRYVEGGMSGWLRRGWPVVPPPRAEGRSG